jgi:hypothetical protein
MRRQLIGVVTLPLALVIAGCAPTLSLHEQDSLAKAKTLVAQTATAYGLMRPYVTVTTEMDRAGAEYKQGNIYLTTRVLASPDLEPLVAHELAHYVLKHESVWTNGTDYDARRAGEAVRILMRAQGMDEPTAVRRVHAWLARLARTRPPARNHFTWCQEIDDLMRRYPTLALRSCPL